MESISLSGLLDAIQGSAAGLRSVTTLQPLEGEGGKIFPATYSGGKYAMEKRSLQDSTGERIVECCLLDSVQSQANRAELALFDQIERGVLQLPMIRVDFADANPRFLKDVENVTSFHAPHRLADAILRDSVLADGTRFSKSKYAEQWRRANLWNATPIFELCPTALEFGMWGSPEKPGGLGAKFERAFVSEIVAVDLLKGEKREGFRLDPLSASSKVGLVPSAEGFEVVSDPKTKGILRPSEINHGNILFESENSGIRCRFVEQTTVISFGALRKLRFPVAGKQSYERDDIARTLLAALGLCAAVLSTERGTSLRSRCNLFPTSPRVWELLAIPGEQPSRFSINGKVAIALLKEAIDAAKKAGLPWNEDPIELKPSPELIALIRASQERMASSGEEAAAS